MDEQDPRTEEEKDEERRQFMAGVSRRLSLHEEEVRQHPIRTRYRDWKDYVETECEGYITSLPSFGGGPFPVKNAGESNTAFNDRVSAHDENLERNARYVRYSSMPLFVRLVWVYACLLWYQVILGQPNDSLSLSMFHIGKQKRRGSHSDG